MGRLVGIAVNQGHPSTSGRAMLIVGTLASLGFAARAGAEPPINLSTIAAGTGGFVINGNFSNQENGSSVSAAGDVDGDGLGDLLIGTPFSDFYDDDAGQVLIVSGKSTTTAVAISSLPFGTNGFSVDGTPAGSNLGNSVCAVGDLNGDGLGDFVIGAEDEVFGGLVDGRVYVVFGRTSRTQVLWSQLLAGTGGFVINSSSPHSIGGEVAGAGDVNGDGLNDLILSSFNTGSHDVFVVFGKTSTAAVNISSIVAATGGFRIAANIANVGVCTSVSSAGDMDGDGLADLILGFASYDSLSGVDSGGAFVVFGKTNTSAVPLSDIAGGTGGFAIRGEAAGDAAGQSVAGVGDANGDGRPDVIVGAPDNSVNGVFAGRAYVVFGKTTPAVVRLSNVVNGTGGFTIDGEDTADGLGRSVNAAGDVNGDGLMDVIVGARSAGDGVPAGRAYVVFGKTTTGLVDTDAVVAGTGGFAMTGEAVSDLAGYSVSGAGDVNGDGLSDVIVSAPRNDAPAFNAGRIYVVFSPCTPPNNVDYIGTVRRDDSERTGIGTTRWGADRTIFPDSRTWVDFASGNNSPVTVNLIRNNNAITNIDAATLADVRFRIRHERNNYGTPRVTFRYTDAEIAGLDESRLRLFHSTVSFDGPWTLLPSGNVNANRNQVAAEVPSLDQTNTFFAIAELQNGDANGDGIINVADFTAIRNFLIGQVSVLPGDADANQDTVIDASDANAIRNYIVNGTPLP